ncbi:MAG TPA: hypothetical protein VFS00_26415 [Polyangiaceae bacterium]|nr:hypothetical protein [Polyangiaceae bacterium]
MTYDPPALSSRERRARRARRALAAFGALVTAFVIWRYGSNRSFLYPLQAVLLSFAAALFLRPGAASQLLARGLLFANLLDGLHEQTEGGPALWPLVAGVSLLAAADVGLGRHSRDAFKPAAYRGLVALIIVVAVAAAQNLAVFGWVYRHWSGPNAPTRYVAGTVMMALAAWLVAAALGLYRLRAWGVLAMGFCGALLAWLMFSNELRLMPYSWTIAYELGLLGLALLALSAPVLWAMTGRAPPPHLTRWLTQALPRWTVATMLAWATALALDPDDGFNAYRILHPQNFVTLSGE